MPIIKLKFDVPTMTKKRPRANHRTGTIYTEVDYKNWKEDAIYLASIQTDVRKVRTQLAYFEFGISDLGVDPDNTEGAILDGITQAKILVSDTFKSIPVHTTIAFPVVEGNEYAKMYFVYNGTPKELKQFIAFVNAAMNKSLAIQAKQT